MSYSDFVTALGSVKHITAEKKPEPGILISEDTANVWNIVLTGGTEGSPLKIKISSKWKSPTDSSDPAYSDYYADIAAEICNLKFIN